VLRDPTIASGVGQFAAIQAVAPDGIELSAVNVHDASTIERAIAAFAPRADGGLIATASPFGRNHPDVIAALAARYRLPAAYPFRYFVTAGGLISYGPNLAILYRPAAEYVDRILKGEKPAELPVQAPTKYELVINLKTAKALGIEIPGSLLAQADEVIE
jgi:putative ABC transport system substrate-binding protein